MSMVRMARSTPRFCPMKSQYRRTPSWPMRPCSKAFRRILDLTLIVDRTSHWADPYDCGPDSKLTAHCKVRDGNQCVFHTTAGQEVGYVTVEAAHLIPHSKTDEYVEQLEVFHGVPEEERTGTVDTPWNLLCVKCTWHKYIGLGKAAALPVPNRFLSADDIDFTPADRFQEDNIIYDAPKSIDPHLSGDENESQSDSRARAQAANETAKREQEADKEQFEEAERLLAHLTSAQGYPDFPRPAELPFNDNSQLVLQYLKRGIHGVAAIDEHIVPHNTAATLRAGTRLSVTALHAIYTCATTTPLIPHIPRFAHLKVPATVSNEAGSSNVISAVQDDIFASRADSIIKRQVHEEEVAEQAWDMLLGWSIPSAVAKQEAE
ncbi:hypothetical protein C8R46DRAFT_1093310 [Mycena filopes]|nr:hypothetical protein C8R46DRAFT_1093310 [Mycena filopes]